LIEQREEKRQRKLAEEKRKEEKKKTEEKPVKILSKSINIEEKENTEKFDKKWVDWNETQNLEKKEELKRNKELIEVNVCDNNEIKGSSLADAFKKKKKDMVKRLENNEKEIVVPNNNENTMIEHRKNSKNVTGNDIQDETNCTRADLRGDNTTIGEILNDSELRPVNISSKILSEKKEKKKNKYEQKNVIVEENEPSKELLDRLIYGKKAELNKKEIKEVNKRMYSKLVESKEKEKDEEVNRKKQELVKNKEKLKQYSENLKNSVVKKQKN